MKAWLISLALTILVPCIIVSLGGLIAGYAYAAVLFVWVLRK